MAELPRNTKYLEESAAQINDIIGAIKNRPAPKNFYTATPQSVSTPRKKVEIKGPFPTGAPSVAEKRTGREPLPPEYANFKRPGKVGAWEWRAPKQGVHLLNMPTGGQLVRDIEGGGIKSGRADGPEERRLLLGNRPSTLYQVDHIIPLWAGGADTPANKETITTAEHFKKTKIQAVPYTLMINGKISRDEALRLSLMWKDKDDTNIPDPDNSGLLPLSVAERKLQEWKKYDREGKPVSFKDVLKEIPTTINVFAKKFPSPVEGFIRGFTSGVTAGWVTPPSDEDAKSLEKVSEFTGNVVGTVLSVGKFARLLGVAPRAATVAKTAMRDLLASRGFVSKAATKTLGRVGSPLASEVTVKTLNRLPKIHSLDYRRLAQLEGGIALYGQLSPEGEVGALAGNQEARPFKRLIEDLAYGAVTGTAGPSIKGAATVGAGTLSIGLMAGDDFEDALLNSATMMGLHALGAKPARVFRERQKNLVNNLMQKEELRAANNVLNSYFPDKFPYLDNVSAKKPKRGLSEQELTEIRKKALQKLDDFAFLGGSKEAATGKLPTNMTYQEWLRERARIITATRALYKQGLPQELREKANVDDLLSYMGRAKRYPSNTLEVPEIARKTLEVFPREMRGKSFIDYDAAKPSGKYPVGRQALTGMAADGVPTNEVIKEYLKRKSAGEAEPTLLLVRRPETAPAWEIRNQKIKEREAVAGKGSPDELLSSEIIDPHPESAIEAYFIFKNKDGSLELRPFNGWFPTSKRIEGSKYAFNKTRKNKLDPSFDNHRVASAMDKNGVSVLFANIDDLNTGTFTKKVEGKIVEQPVVEVTLNDKNWEQALAIKKLLAQRGALVTDTVEDAIKKLGKAQNPADKQVYTEAVRQKYDEPVDTIISAIPAGNETSTSLRNGTAAFLGEIRESIQKSKNPRELLMNLMEKNGIVLREGEAATIFAKKNNLTLRETLDTVVNAMKEKRASGSAIATYNAVVAPFFRSLPQEIRLSLSEMRLLPNVPQKARFGGLKKGAVSPKQRDKRAGSERAVQQTPQERVKPAPSRGESPTTASQGAEGAPKAAPEKLPVLATQKTPPINSQTPSQTPKIELSEFKNKKTTLPTTPQGATQKTPVSEPVSPSVSTGQVTEPVSLAEKFKKAYEKGKGEVITRQTISKKRESKRSATQDPFQKKIQAHAEDLVLQARGLIDEVMGKRSKKDRTLFIKDVNDIIRQVNPSDKLTRSEFFLVKKKAQDILKNYAFEVTNRKFSPEEELNFLTGERLSSLRDTEKQIVQKILQADTAKRLKMIDAYNSIIEDLQKNYKTNLVSKWRKSLGINALDKIKKTAYREDHEATQGAVEKDSKSFFESIDKGLKANPASYAYYRAKSFDETFRALFGENYRSNEELKRILTDKTREGRFLWKDILYKTTNAAGREIVQPKNVILQMAEGDKKKLFKEFQKRRKEVVQNGKTPGEAPKSNKISAQDISGLRVRPDVQDEGLVHDLTYGESVLYPGIVAATIDNRMTATRGVEDAKGVVLKMIKIINENRRKKKLFLPPSLFEKIKKEAKRAQEAARDKNINKYNLKKMIPALEKQYKNLEAVLESSAAQRPKIRKEVEEGLQDLKAKLEKIKKAISE